MLVQSARAVARGPVARLVAAGGAQHARVDRRRRTRCSRRSTSAGITAVFIDPEQGGFIDGPEEPGAGAGRLRAGLGGRRRGHRQPGAATSRSRRSTSAAPPSSARIYMRPRAPPQPGEDRAAVARRVRLTEPIPYVGVETGLLGGKVRVAEWKDGQEPILQVDKRGRFITNMGFANFVTAAVDSDDPRIKGSCMVILEEDDPGIFDRGAPTRKLVHQLSSTRDPVFSLRVPASRIVGGYTVKDGVIVPQLQPRRDHRGGLPPHARHGGR